MTLELSRRDEMVQVELGDAKIECKPYRATHYTIAKMKTLKALEGLKNQRKEELEMGVETTVPDLSDNEIYLGMYTHIFNVEVAKQVILSWDGVSLNGEPAKLTPENITRLLEDGFLQEQFIGQFMKLQKEVEAEKKS